MPNVVAVKNCILDQGGCQDRGITRHHHRGPVREGSGVAPGGCAPTA